MNKQDIAQLKQSFDQHLHILDGSNVEFCYARDLMGLLGYDRWENFLNPIDKAKNACKNSKVAINDHFRDVTKMVPIGSIAAKNLATEITNHNTQQHDLHGEKAITDEHIQNNQSVRDMLGQRGIKPGKLPAEEDLKKLERRVASAEKKLIKESALPKNKGGADE